MARKTDKQPTRPRYYADPKLIAQLRSTYDLEGIPDGKVYESVILLLRNDRTGSPNVAECLRKVEDAMEHEDTGFSYADLDL